MNINFSTRRHFILGLLTTLFLSCTKSNKDKQNEENISVYLDKITNFTISYTPFTQYRIAIIKSQEEGSIFLRAISLICTHQSCLIKKSDEKNFICPCHGAIFDHDGTPVSGPAKRDLEWRKLEIKGDEIFLFPTVLVDKNWKLNI